MDIPATPCRASEAARYRAPRWLRGGHAQTIYAALAAPRPRISYRRERWDTPDGDFIDLDWVVKPAEAAPRFNLTDGKEYTQPSLSSDDSILEKMEPATVPLVVLFHGLEGSSRSHYALSLMGAVKSAGWRGCVVHFRGCGGELNRLPRAYHSGDSAEADWILRRLKRDGAPLFAAGFSLGGNVLLKWLGETGASAREMVDRAAAVSAPVDLTACGNALERGLNLAYTYRFLRSMKRKSRAKLERFPGLFDLDRMLDARTLREFDNVVTAPLHGFRDTDDYWTRASSKPLLRGITVPTLMINARDDPFLPCGALPAPHEVASSVLLEQPEHGGHAGFVAGPFPGDLRWFSRRILDFLGAPDPST